MTSVMDCPFLLSLVCVPGHGCHASFTPHLPYAISQWRGPRGGDELCFGQWKAIRVI